MLTRMKNSIYVIIQTEKLREGLFMGPSFSKYLKEDISAWHVRASLTLKLLNPPHSPSTTSFSVSYISVGCGVMLQKDAYLQPS